MTKKKEEGEKEKGEGGEKELCNHGNTNDKLYILFK